ncbi:MAG: MBL fold metallo-hydrolase [candidate division Zixibacteria bacterium]|nr:MBL fold metallo-hydrolase [candidate division Zixibacteria bacterium]
MKLGEFEIDSFVEYEFKLDGGGMFGVVPKKIWNRLIPADENNLIPMVTRLFVLRAHGKVMIFDIGLGDTLSDQEKKIYGIHSESMLESGLQGLGLTVNDIDYVILSHLHTDHAGGAVKKEGDKFVPRFPNAKHIIDRREWSEACNPNERTSAVYIPARYQALEDTGRVELIDPDIELFPGIRAVHTGGHTIGHFGLQIESGGEQLWYYADIFCTSAHIPVPYVPATDLYPLKTMEVKRRALPEIVNDGVIVAFDHDVNMPFGRVKQEGKKIKVKAVDE